MSPAREKTITKRELIELLSRKTVLSKKEVERFLYHFTGLVTEALQYGEKVQLIPFGTFSTQERKGRKVKNPRTGREVAIEKKRVPVFRPGKMLRMGIR